MKKIYIVKDFNDEFGGRYQAYFTNKKEVEKYVKEHDEITTNSYGITSHSVVVEEVEIGKFKSY